MCVGVQPTLYFNVMILKNSPIKGVREECPSIFPKLY